MEAVYMFSNMTKTYSNKRYKYIMETPFNGEYTPKTYLS